MQGEGLLVGTPSIFVRLDTCNLRCAWGETLCDAAYTSWSPGSLRTTVGELGAQIGLLMKVHKCRHVVLTGGEPFLQKAAVQGLSLAVFEYGGHMTIETNGTRYLSSTADLICLSPKLKSSTPLPTVAEEKWRKLHEQHRWNPQVIRQFMTSGSYFFKFVMDDYKDLIEICAMLKEVQQPLPDPEHVVLMPQGITPTEIWARGPMVADACKAIGARFSPRTQIDLWGNKPGT